MTLDCGMSGVSAISGLKYIPGPRVVGKLSFHRWDPGLAGESGARSSPPATVCTKMHSTPTPTSGRGYPALSWEQYWVEGCRRAPLLPLPPFLPLPLHLWPWSDRTQQTGKDALTAKKCSEFKPNPTANLTSAGVWSLSWSGYVLAEPKALGGRGGHEIRCGAGLQGVGSPQPPPTRKEAAGGSPISAVTSFPRWGFHRP